jgi:hypothetical protein
MFSAEMEGMEGKGREVWEEREGKKEREGCDFPLKELLIPPRAEESRINTEQPMLLCGIHIYCRKRSCTKKKYLRTEF